MDQILDLGLPQTDRLSVSTLGPPGTSSEAAANHLVRIRQRFGYAVAGHISLHQTYEQAYQSVLDCESDLLLVANAYAGVNAFYMDCRLNLTGTFLMYTPNYGIAMRRGPRPTEPVLLATHPAPKSLIPELLPKDIQTKEIIYTSSTSQAAAAVAEGTAQACLTTEIAAAKEDLVFVSRTRPIRMLWAVFTRNSRDSP